MIGEDRGDIVERLVHLSFRDSLLFRPPEIAAGILAAGIGGTEQIAHAPGLGRGDGRRAAVAFGTVSQQRRQRTAEAMRLRGRGRLHRPGGFHSR